MSVVDAIMITSRLPSLIVRIRNPSAPRLFSSGSQRSLRIRVEVCGRPTTMDESSLSPTTIGVPISPAQPWLSSRTNHIKRCGLTLNRNRFDSFSIYVNRLRWKLFISQPQTITIIGPCPCTATKKNKNHKWFHYIFCAFCAFLWLTVGHIYEGIHGFWRSCRPSLRD